MSCFSGILNQSDAFASLNRAWTTGSRPVGAVGLSETGKALVLHALYEEQKKPLLVLTPDEASAVKLTEDLRTLQGDVLLYPTREMNLVQVGGASHEDELLRLESIHTLRYHWVKGHAVNEFNNRCDEMAEAESRKFR